MISRKTCDLSLAPTTIPPLSGPRWSETGRSASKQNLTSDMKSNPKLAPFAEEKGFLNVLVESSKGTRNKYAYAPESGFLALKRVLPGGMMFPFNFGALPGTLGEDGDPLDILVLMEDAVTPPCLVQAH